MYLVSGDCLAEFSCNLARTQYNWRLLETYTFKFPAVSNINLMDAQSSEVE
jgi:hypothetical protein